MRYPLTNDDLRRAQRYGWRDTEPMPELWRWITAASFALSAVCIALALLGVACHAFGEVGRFMRGV